MQTSKFPLTMGGSIVGGGSTIELARQSAVNASRDLYPGRVVRLHDEDFRAVLDEYRDGEVVTEMPEAWSDLIAALTLFATRPGDTVSPLHCEHDTLHVMAYAEKFTPEELAQLATWGFHVDSADGAFYSFRFGSA